MSCNWPREDLANPPTLEEILAAVSSIKSGKTLGLDGIHAEIYNTDLPGQLLKLYRVCWTAQELPQHLKDALTIAIYKKEG